MDTTTETKVKQSAISRLIKAGSKQITVSDIIELNKVHSSLMYQMFKLLFIQQQKIYLKNLQKK